MIAVRGSSAQGQDLPGCPGPQQRQEIDISTVRPKTTSAHEELVASTTPADTPAAPRRRRRVVAVATDRAHAALDGDGPPLLEALDRAGLVPAVAVWDDPDQDWQSYDLVLVRNTWDYTLRRAEFLRWAERCPATANPADILRWSTDKHYLHELETEGVPVVPTSFVEPGSGLHVPGAWQSGEVVVKPAVSASAADTGRFHPDDPAAVALVRRLHGQGRSAMLQPYVRQVDSAGETALVFLSGTFSHAVRKAAVLTGPGEREPVVGDDVLDAITPAVASQAQLDVAAAALAAVPGGPERLTYARVDMVPDDSGTPTILELELAEPSLFLRYAPPGALDRWAAAIAEACAPS